MIIKLLCAAVIGGLIGAAELVARYRDRPGEAALSPSGLVYVSVNAVAALVALVVVVTAGFRFGLPAVAPAAGLSVVQVVTAGLGSAAVLRASVTVVHDRGITMGPISLLHALLTIVDAAMARKRALARLSGDELDGLSFARDHVALAQLACHALPRFDLAEARRLGELAADLRSRDDLTDADKLDCFGLELAWLVGDRALAKAADRLRARPEPADESREPGEWWHATAGRYGSAAWADDERRRPAEARPGPRAAAALPRGSGPARQAGPAGRADGERRSLLDTREDVRRPAVPAEPRPGGAGGTRPVRRSRSVS
ncbi:MAG TPA: hypothetical protein VF069_11545 [Streptosporangiaceae bacterium]